MSQSKTVTYVTYLLPGAMMSETSTHPVDGRDPHREAALAPTMAFAFYYTDTLETEGEYMGRRVMMESEPLNKSGVYYINATLVPVDSLPDDIVKHNVQCWKASYAVYCRTGNVQPYFDGRDSIITSR